MPRYPYVRLRPGRKPQGRVTAPERNLGGRMKRRMVGGDEVDAFTGWCRLRLWRSGQRKTIKQRASRQPRCSGI